MFRMNMPLPSSGMGESDPSWLHKVSQTGGLRYSSTEFIIIASQYKWRYYTHRKHSQPSLFSTGVSIRQIYIYNHHFTVSIRQLHHTFTIITSLPFLCMLQLLIHNIFTTTTSQCVNSTVYIHNHHFSVCQQYSIHSQPPLLSMSIVQYTFTNTTSQYGNSTAYIHNHHFSVCQ